VCIDYTKAHSSLAFFFQCSSTSNHQLHFSLRISEQFELMAEQSFALRAIFIKPFADPDHHKQGLSGFDDQILRIQNLLNHPVTVYKTSNFPFDIEGSIGHKSLTVKEIETGIVAELKEDQELAKKPCCQYDSTEFQVIEAGQSFEIIINFARKYELRFGHVHYNVSWDLVSLQGIETFEDLNDAEWNRSKNLTQLRIDTSECKTKTKSGGEICTVS
jgi:hypothetical protein